MNTTAIVVWYALMKYVVQTNVWRGLELAYSVVAVIACRGWRRGEGGWGDGGVGGVEQCFVFGGAAWLQDPSRNDSSYR